MYSSTMMLSWGLFQEGCKAGCRGANQTLCIATHWGQAGMKADFLRYVIKRDIQTLRLENLKTHTDLKIIKNKHFWKPYPLWRSKTEATNVQPEGN